ncbi:hypothetical protein ABMA28_006853 [Loxostege sticticalis]|uniref:Protein rolling stone n=1 Tax=Loxostege sticticalis TaxID=481309 RepID=A0ABD0TNN2_LOXSC
MGAIRDQFRWKKLKLQDDNASDFYLSCWQRNRMAMPMLCIRLVLFAGCLGILLSSMLLPERIIYIDYWALYLTQWGLLMNLITTGMATAVSAVAYFKGPIDATFGLPWYIRLFWGCYCISVPVAFHITVFYYSFVMASMDEFEEYDLNPVLDVFTHGVNSIIMFLLLFTSNISVYFVQFLFPFAFMVIYMVFTIIYYYAGGTNPFGDRFIYLALDWGEPITATATVFISAGVVTSLYIVVVLMTVLRNLLSRKLKNDNLYIIS